MRNRRIVANRTQGARCGNTDHALAIKKRFDQGRQRSPTRWSDLPKGPGCLLTKPHIRISAQLCERGNSSWFTELS
jgi:hypothetical protein